MDDRTLLERAAKMVIYNQETGSMIWREKDSRTSDSNRWNARYAGHECGSNDGKGYRRIRFKFDTGEILRVRVHRLAWYMVFGVPPSGEIDHINQNKADNRLSNLRDVPKELNQRNGTRKRNNTSGVPGVYWHKQRKKWCAQASMDGKHYHLGLFTDMDEAEKITKMFRAANGFTDTHGRIVRAAAAMAKDET